VVAVGGVGPEAFFTKIFGSMGKSKPTPLNPLPGEIALFIAPARRKSIYGDLYAVVTLVLYSSPSQRECGAEILEIQRL
jgi:hypothetical protein